MLLVFLVWVFHRHLLLRRNEVWKYDQKMFLTPNERMTRFFFRGFKYAAAAMLVTIAADKLGLLGSRGHGHGEHGHH